MYENLTALQYSPYCTKLRNHIRYLTLTRPAVNLPQGRIYKARGLAALLRFSHKILVILLQFLIEIKVFFSAKKTCLKCIHFET